jgi:cytosine/adenosine deaminase-related metal-dependent hydrolase
MNTYRSAGILIATILAIIASSPAGTAETYDLVILNGRVMDPESGLDAVRNVGVKGGKIVEITETKIDGKETIDATGHVVAPGFIDLHIHGQDPYAIKLLLRDGVTSALEIEFGAYPVEDYYNKREGKWQANFGTSVGHGWARMNAMDGVDPKGLGLYSGAMKVAARKGAKWSKKRSEPKQLKAIIANVEHGLRQGGLGIGMPVGYYTAVGSAEIAEIVALAKRYNSFIATHVRYLSQIPPSGYLGVEEFLAAAAVHDVRLIVHHVPSNCMRLTVHCLNLIDAARKRGLKVVGEFYPYTFGSTLIGAGYLGPGFQERTGMDYMDIADMKTGETMTKELLAKKRKENPGRLIIMRHIKERDMLAAFRRPGVFVGADSLPFIDEKSGLPSWDAPYGVAKGHPRGAGTHAKVLRLVRERHVVPLMAALEKLSYLQAKFLEDMVPNMKLRGRVKPGAVADITIFDPESVSDNAVWADGKYSLPSTGIPYVIVNGTIVVKDSEVLKDVLPGQPIRNALLN